MKRKLVTLLAGLMILSTVGCGSTSVPASSEASVAATESTSEISTEESSEESVEESVEEIEYRLRELFASHNMKVGTCLTTQMIGNKRQSALILDQFSSVTMENSMKPDYLFNKSKSVEEGQLVVEFNNDALKMMEWAKENGLSMRGHTLVWYSQSPAWIFYEDFDTKKDMVSRKVMLERMESYISQVFALLDELGYTDIFYAYDVVNEAWMEDGTMRENNWSKTIGDDYLWYAFYFADKYAPESIDLYYNDYNEQFKTNTLVKFVKTLVDEDGNYLIDGVGFQAHLYTSDNLDSYFQTMDTIAELGVKIQLTELDVCLGAYQKPLSGTDENLQKQGRFYYNLINGIFERVDAGTVQMDALTFWGFGDNLSWRKEYKPMLYNDLLLPKYAYYGAMQVKELAGYGNN